MDRRSTRIQRLRAARLYLVCDDQPDEFLEESLRGGVDIVQLRMKDAEDGRIVATGRRFGRICGAHGVLFILNDRPDLVAECSADGVHVGQDDMPVLQARSVVGPERLVGLSTHTPAQIERASAGGDDRAGAPDRDGVDAPDCDHAGAPDYIGVGPVFETPTKPSRPAVGPELVRYATAHARMPFFAIGGIGPDNVERVRRAGAARIAVVRALTESAVPEQAARQLRGALVSEEEQVGAA